jgi:hypothetical protein
MPYLDLPSEEVREEREFDAATKDGVPANLEKCWLFMGACREEAEERDNPPPKKKSIVRKRKKPQRKIKQFYKLEKKPKKKVVKNFQGFPVDKCEYSDEIDDLVYVPKDYEAHRPDAPVDRMWLCEHCLLMPCLVYTHSDKIFSLAGEDAVRAGTSTLKAINFEAARVTRAAMLKLFGKRYAKKIPQCAVEAINEQYPYDIAAPLSDSDSDSDFETGPDGRLRIKRTV